MKLRYHCVDDFQDSEKRVFDIDGGSEMLENHDALIDAFLKCSGAIEIKLVYFDGYMLTVRYKTPTERVYLAGFVTTIYSL